MIGGVGGDGVGDRWMVVVAAVFVSVAVAGDGGG